MRRCVRGIFGLCGCALGLRVFVVWGGLRLVVGGFLGCRGPLWWRGRSAGFGGLCGEGGGGDGWLVDFAGFAWEKGKMDWGRVLCWVGSEGSVCGGWGSLCRV